MLLKNPKLKFAGYSWERKKFDFIAKINKAYYCDTSQGDILLTLPLYPKAGDKVIFLANGLYSLRIHSTQKINGLPRYENFVLKASEHLIYFFSYTNSSVGWSYDIKYSQFLTEEYLGNGDSLFNKVSLYITGNGQNNSTQITDQSLSQKQITVSGNTKISTNQSVNGGGSIFFDGVNSTILTQTSTDFIFGYNDFTIELWAYTTNRRDLLGFRKNNSELNCIALGDYGGTFSYSWPGITAILIENYQLNQWNHIAICKHNNVYKAFVNGIQKGQSLNYSFNETGDQIEIGTNGYVGQYRRFGEFYMNFLRITKGVSRYNSNFNSFSDTFLF